MLWLMMVRVVPIIIHILHIFKTFQNIIKLPRSEENQYNKIFLYLNTWWNIVIISVRWKWNGKPSFLMDRTSFTVYLSIISNCVKKHWKSFSCKETNPKNLIRYHMMIYHDDSWDKIFICVNRKKKNIF